MFLFRWDVLIEIFEAQKQRISRLGVEFSQAVWTEAGEPQPTGRDWYFSIVTIY
jgi:hypothetical protein